MFHYVVRRGMISVVKAIVRRMRADGLEGAAVHKRLESAAELAVTALSLPSLKALVEEGLDVAQARVEEDVAGKRVVSGLLHFAYRWGAKGIVPFLVEQGCDALARDSDGCMIHHVAVGAAGAAAVAARGL